MNAKHRLRTISWIAIFAIVASVLAPVASRAMAAWAGTNGPWDEICSSLGFKTVAAKATDRSADPPAEPSDAGMRGACPYCLPSAEPTGLPAQPAGTPPTADTGSSRFLFFFISAPHPQSVPDAIRARGPPRIA